MLSPPPAAHILRPASQTGLTIQPVNGHIESRFSASTQAWSPPEFVQDPHLKVHGLSPGLNYGQQCYEGLKAFRTPKDTIQIFRPDFHGKRLAHSASFVSMPAPSVEHFVRCVELAVAMNAEYVPSCEGEAAAFMYIRPVLFGSSAQLMLAPPDEYVFAVYVQPIRPYHGSQALDALVLEDFDRAAPFGTGSAKLGGNYSPVYRHQARAKNMGYGITLHLDSATRTYVEEFSTSGFLGVKVEEVDGIERRVLCVPETDNAIRSATSDSMVAMAEKEGWIIERGKADPTKLSSLTTKIEFNALTTFTAVLAVGTAAACVPIRSITRLSTSTKYLFTTSEAVDGPGLHLARLVKDVQCGKATDDFGWCRVVTAPPAGFGHCEVGMKAGEAQEGYMVMGPYDEAKTASGARTKGWIDGAWSSRPWRRWLAAVGIAAFD